MLLWQKRCDACSAEKFRGEAEGDAGLFARKLKRYLSAGACVDAVDAQGNTALHWVLAYIDQILNFNYMHKNIILVQQHIII